MSITESLLAYLVAVTVLTLTPGMDTALILRTASVESRAQAMKAALGISTGCLLWGAAVALGLGALLAVSELAFTILKYCGAAYLCWLGLGMLLKPRTSLAIEDTAGSKGRPNWFIKGLLGNLLNPKIGIFYVSFLPQFIPQGQPLALWTFGLVGVHVAIGLVWAATLIGVTRQLGRFLKHRMVIQWLDRATGSIFLVFATKLALSRQ
ncbi:LysE family translocator [Stutzerimonas urumqiensis]|uniref:LysE family translocator n=1 Tax=Stutzerimonas urumqiensis TaxID=638269 RepID=UPI000EAFD104|nr:LysE family translocator [Stutzerimonas urumqiensis]